MVRGRQESDTTEAARSNRETTPPFFDRVFAIVARIPNGRVTTYGAIARALGEPRAARGVGWALHLAPAELPCHRVVNRHGFLSGGWHFGHPDVMADRLAAEAIPFRDMYQVDLDACFWDPDTENQGETLLGS
jgi:methylated-DNA-protein-cysteine methyltransferase-like protein